jgi:hypothetical protein
LFRISVSGFVLSKDGCQTIDDAVVSELTILTTLTSAIVNYNDLFRVVVICDCTLPFE